MALEQDSWDPRDTWEPVDLRGAIDMAESPYPEFDLDEPGTLFRADGVGLLYEERVNGFHGEPESGEVMARAGGGGRGPARRQVGPLHRLRRPAT